MYSVKCIVGFDFISRDEKIDVSVKTQAVVSTSV